MNHLGTVDPQWAWSPYEPGSGNGWSQKQWTHLSRRAGLGAAEDELKQYAKFSPAELAHHLVTNRSETEAELREYKDLAQSVLATGDARNLTSRWIHRLLNSPDQLQEKTTLFWHGHFATSADKVTDPILMLQQNELLRKYALGDFGKLLHEISRDPAMLIYLDSVTNRKNHPNENFAREIMELFCLGEGNYTEKDIRELAKCFTGWEIKQRRYRFNKYQHDYGSKTLFGKSGEFSGDEGVDIVLQQAAGPEFIVSKLMRFFLFDEPAAPEALVKPLAKQLRENDWQIGPVIEMMLSSNLFYSEHVVAQKVRSPIEFSLGFLRSLEGTTNLLELTTDLNDLGQTLFFPPNVKGWDGGRAWINSSTLLARANLVRKMLDRKQTRFAGGGLVDLFDKHRLKKPKQIVDWLQARLFAIGIPADVRNSLVRKIDSGKGDREQRLRNALHIICTLPEYQLA